MQNLFCIATHKLLNEFRTGSKERHTVWQCFYKIVYKRVHKHLTLSFVKVMTK